MPGRIAIKIPELADGIKKIKLVEWLVKEGDNITKGVPVAIVETEKFAVEIEAPDTGVIENIIVSEGTKVNLTDTLGYIKKINDHINLNKTKSEQKIKDKTSAKSLRQIFKRMINKD